MFRPIRKYTPVLGYRIRLKNFKTGKRLPALKNDINPMENFFIGHSINFLIVFINIQVLPNSETNLGPSG